MGLFVELYIGYQKKDFKNIKLKQTKKIFKIYMILTEPNKIILVMINKETMKVTLYIFKTNKK